MDSPLWKRGVRGDFIEIFNSIGVKFFRSSLCCHFYCHNKEEIFVQCQASTPSYATTPSYAKGLNALLILRSVPIDNPPNHFLIGYTMPLCLFLKKIDTRLF